MMRKIILLAITFLFGACCFLGGFLYTNLSVKKNQSIGEAKKAEYEDKFLNISSKIIANTYSSLLITGGISATWSTAIQYEYGFFNNKILQYLDDSKDILEKMESINKEIEIGMQELKNYPIQYQEAYNIMMEMYSIYSQIYSLAQAPSGSLMSFNNKINDLQLDFTKYASKLKVFMPNLEDSNYQDYLNYNSTAQEGPEKADVQAKPTVTLQEFLAKFIDIQKTFYKANDAYVYGLNATIMPHEKRYYPKKFSISPDIYTAKELFQNAYDKLDKLDCDDKTATEIKDVYLTSLKKSLESTELVLSGLKVSGLYFAPDWNKVKEGIAKIRAHAEEHNNADKKLFSLIEKNAPFLKEKIPSNLLFHLDGSEKILENENLPWIGFLPASASDKVMIIETVQGSPARKYGLELGDVIVGVKNGKKIQSMRDYFDFLHTCKVGDVIPFTIIRKGNEIVLKIKLGQRPASA